MAANKIDRFVKEYLIDCNGLQAAIRAGYSKKTAQQQASRLLSNVKVKEAIAAGQEKKAEKLSITALDLVKEYEEVRNKAMESSQLAAANSAIAGKAKLLGLEIDKSEVKITHEQWLDTLK